MTVKVWVTTALGLESVLGEELRSRFHCGKEQIHAGQEGQCFANLELDVITRKRLRGIKCGEKLRVCVLEVTEPRLSKEKDHGKAMALLEDMVVKNLKAETVQDALKVLAEFNGENEVGSISEVAMFRIMKRNRSTVAKDATTHCFRSPDLGPPLASGMTKVLKKWIPSLENDPKYKMFHFDVKVTDDLLQIGLNLTKPEHRLWQLDNPLDETKKKWCSTPLKPFMANCLAMATEVRAGEILVDPCAGGGTIGIAAVNLNDETPVFSIMGDVDDHCIEIMAHNKAICKFGEYIDIVRWDVCQGLPLRDGSIQRFATDLPFGKRCGNKKVNRELYPATVSEIMRCMDDKICSSSRAVFITTDKGGLTNLKQNKRVRYSYHTYASIRLRMSGLEGRLVIIGNPPKADDGGKQQTNIEIGRDDKS